MTHEHPAGRPPIDDPSDPARRATTTATDASALDPFERPGAVEAAVCSVATTDTGDLDGASPACPTPTRPERSTTRANERASAEPPISWAEWAAVVVIVLVAGWLAVLLHSPGHEWGDDQSLYLSQTKALLRGAADRVAADTRFALDASGWDFSPVTYPWGFPALLAPVYAVTGLDYDALKIVPTIGFLVALVAFHTVLRRRMHPALSLLIVTILATSANELWMTDWVISDHVYTAIVACVFVMADRLRDRGFDGSRPLMLVALGGAMALAVETRREGLAAVAAVLAYQLVSLVRVSWQRRAPGQPRIPHLRWSRVRWPWVALPYVVCVASIAAVQALLPGELFPSYRGAGFQNAGLVWDRHRGNFAQIVGLRDVFATEPVRLYGSEVLGSGIVWVIVALAVLGITARAVTALRSDAPLIAYLGLSVVALARTPFYEPRYLFPLVPLVLYFAVQAIPASMDAASIVRRTVTRTSGADGVAFAQGRTDPLRRSAVAALTGVALLTPLLLETTGETRRYASRHLRVEAPAWGPATPSTRELFQSVRALTGEDDVVSFFRARTMTLSTGRRSFQPLSIDTLLEHADWYAMLRGSDYSQVPLTPEEAASHRLTLAWENDGWILWRVNREPTAVG